MKPKLLETHGCQGGAHAGFCAEPLGYSCTCEANEALDAEIAAEADQ